MTSIMKINTLILFIIIYINTIHTQTTQPPYPNQFPTNIAYIAQASSCNLNDIYDWSCPPCRKSTESFILLDYYTVTGIKQFIYYNNENRNIVIAYEYSYSKEVKPQYLCTSNPVVTSYISDKNNGECLLNIEFYIIQSIDTILMSSDQSIGTVLDLLYNRITNVIIDYELTNIDYIYFTGYELGGSIAQVVNSYYMVKETVIKKINDNLQGCLPPSNVRLYQFASPRTMNFIHDDIDAVYQNSPLYNVNYKNSYWWLYNLASYRDPIVSYPSINFNNINAEYLQTVYYEGINRVGYCIQKDNCFSQRPPVEQVDFSLNNHYSIYEIPFSPNTATNNEYCNYYPDQLRNFNGEEPYIDSLCFVLLPQGISDTCVTDNTCPTMSNQRLCDCTSECKFKDSENPELPYECCTDICVKCENDICVSSGPPPPPTNTGPTCNQAITLESPTIINRYITTGVNIQGEQTFGYSFSNCPELVVLPSTTVVWFRINTLFTGQYNFNSFNSGPNTAITMWLNCNVQITCLATSNNNQGTQDGSISPILIANNNYYISITSDVPLAQGDFVLNYAILSIVSGDNSKNRYSLSRSTINDLFTHIIKLDSINSCSNRCNENYPISTTIAEACDCYVTCNPFTNPRCCPDICQFCTYGEDNESPSNQFCLRAEIGEYSGSCVGRCEEDIPPPGCLCNLEAVFSKQELCLDFEEACPLAEIVIDPKYDSCINRCGKGQGFDQFGNEDPLYLCSCTDTCHSSNTCCNDITDPNINCPNKHMRQNTVSTSCVGRCGVDPPNSACSCEADCQIQQNCCNDYCPQCLPGQVNCDLNTNELNFPPTVYERQKYYQLSQSPRCDKQTYANWRCYACVYYSGYIPVIDQPVTFRDIIDIFIHYNPNKKETIITLSNTNSFSFFDAMESMESNGDFTSVNYKDSTCPNIMVDNEINYYTKYHDIAAALDVYITGLIGGYDNYFSDKKGSTLTFIGHNQAGGIAHMIYDKFVMRRNILQYKKIFGVCPSSDKNGACFAKYYTDTSTANAITVQGFVTAEPNIINDVDSVTYEKLLGIGYNGLTVFNTDYRMFSIVNSYDFYSNIIVGYAGFQTYYTRPAGGITMYPCFYYGSLCFPVEEIVVNVGALTLIATTQFGFANSEIFSQVITCIRNQKNLAFNANSIPELSQDIAENLSFSARYIREIRVMGLIGNRLYTSITSLKTWAINLSAVAAFNIVMDISSVEFDFFIELVQALLLSDINNTFFGITLNDICGVIPSQLEDKSDIFNFISEEELHSIFDEFIRQSIVRKNFISNNNTTTTTTMSNKYTEQDTHKNTLIDLYELMFSINRTSKAIQEVKNNNIQLNIEPTTDVDSFIYSKDSSLLTESLIKSTFIEFKDLLYSLSNFRIPVLITDKPSTLQFNLYYEIMSIGFAPYEEISNFNCTLCIYYSNLGYALNRWEHYDYYDLFWIISPIRKEVIILMSTDNYPGSIYDLVCEDKKGSGFIDLGGPLPYLCIEDIEFEEFDTFYATNDSEIMFPTQRFTQQYLSNDYTVSLMRNPVYKDYIYTYVGFGNSASYIYNMFVWGYYNYNENRGSYPYNSK